MLLPLEECLELARAAPARLRSDRPARGCFAFAFAQASADRRRSTCRRPPELLRRRGELALGDGEQTFDAEAEAFLEPELLLESLASKPERARALSAPGRSRGTRHRCRWRATPRSRRRRDRPAGAGRPPRETRAAGHLDERCAPLKVSMPTLTKMPGGSLTLSRAA